MLKIQRIAVATIAFGLFLLPASTSAVATPVTLGSAATFAVLGGSAMSILT